MSEYPRVAVINLSENSGAEILSQILMAILAENGDEIILPSEVLGKLSDGDALETAVNKEGDLRVRRIPSGQEEIPDAFISYTESRNREPYLGKQQPVRIRRPTIY